MSAPEPTHPLAAFPRGPYGAASAAPVRVSMRARDIVQVMARRGREEALATAMQAAFGLALPGPCRASTANGVTAIWIQPGQWLLSAPRGEEGTLAARAAAACEGLAAVADQSHGRTTIAVSGPAARAVLARGCRLDLHPRAFGLGHAASTLIAQIGCLVHQTDDAPTFELTVFSTLADPFFRWLLDAGAGSGLLIA